MHTQNYKRWAIGLCVLAFVAPTTRAQQQEQPADNSNPSGPIPAYHSPLAGAAGNGQSTESPQELMPDTNSLSGAQVLTLGMPLTRTYWQPSFNYSGSADSNPITTQGSGNSWTGWNTLTGEIDVHRVSGDNNLALTYVVGGMIAGDGPGGSGIVQELSATDKIMFRRWSLSLIEELSYLPPSGFGLNNLAGVGIGGIGGTGGIGTVGGPPPLNPGLGPGQTLLTTSGQSLSNSSVAEVNTQLTNRTSLTFVGGYSVLRYLDNSELDYGDVSVQAGYNYQWTRKDTLAVVYSYSGFRYSNFDQSINSHAVQLSYGRRLTGRLAFQVAAGPQIASFQEAIPSGSMSAGVTGSQTSLYWTANAALTYQLRRGALSGSYYHGVSGGSGVLVGSVTDTASGSLSQQLSHSVSGSITTGYSRNHGVAINTVPPATSAQTYDYWSAGGSLSRAWGRTLNLSLSYQMQYQTSDAAFCLGVTCGTSYFRNVISVGMSWHEHPLLF